MSVKDKIAMWNNMGNSTNTPPPKLVSTAPNPKPKPQDSVQPPLSHSSHQKNQLIETDCVLKPSELKKKSAAQLIQIITKTTPESQSKTMGSSIKPLQGLKKQNSSTAPQPVNTVKLESPVKKQVSQPNVGNVTSSQFEIETTISSKPSDIKKKLEQGGNALNFFPPQPLKKVQSVTIHQNTQPNPTSNPQYQIERDVPRISVKENALKLAEFYNKKKEQESQPKIQVPKQQVFAQEESEYKSQQTHQTVPNQIATTHVQTHSQPIPTQQVTTIPEVKQQQNDPQQAQAGQLDIAARLREKNKRRKMKFDSDDD